MEIIDKIECDNPGCPSVLSSANKLMRHKLDCKFGTERKECKNAGCNRRFQTENELLDHLKTCKFDAENRKTRVECTNRSKGCPSVLIDDAALRDHLRKTCHFTGKIWVCRFPKCLREFPTYSTRYTHEATCKKNPKNVGKRFLCDQCGDKFEARAYLLKHKRLMHKKGKGKKGK